MSIGSQGVGSNKDRIASLIAVGVDPRRANAIGANPWGNTIPVAPTRVIAPAFGANTSALNNLAFGQNNATTLGTASYSPTQLSQQSAQNYKANEFMTLADYAAKQGHSVFSPSPTSGGISALVRR